MGGTLLVVALLATLAFALAGVSISHLSLLARSTGNTRAQNLARSVVAEGIARLLEDKSYGAARLPSEHLTIQTDHGTAHLAFDEATAEGWGIPASTNNIEGSGSVEGPAGRVVPAAAVHLVGVARADGHTRTVEAFLHVPPFSYAIASSGPVRSQGGVLVGALKAGQTLDSQPTIDDLLPADLVSNAADDDAVYLGADTMVSGDVQAAGGVVVSQASSTAILGEVRQQAGITPVPDIDPLEFDPQARNQDFEAVQGVLPQVISGSVRSDRSVTLDGGLELDGALLFVDGDLTITGGLKGTGVIVVTGRTTVSGEVNVQSGQKVALISRGQIALTGQGQFGSRFRGLVYTEEGIRADRVTVEGTMIVAGEPTAPGVSLKDARVLHDPEVAVVPLPTPTAAAPPPASSTPTALLTPHTHYYRVEPNPPDRPNIINAGPGDYDIMMEVVVQQGQYLITTSNRIDPGNTQGKKFSGTHTDINDKVINFFLECESNLVYSMKPEYTGLAAALQVKVFGTEPKPSPTPEPGPDPVTEPVGGAAVELIDPSEFLSIEDRIRLLHWSEY